VIGFVQAATRLLVLGVGSLFLALTLLAVLVPISGSQSENTFVIALFLVLGSALIFGGSRMQARTLVEVGVGPVGLSFTYSDRVVVNSHWRDPDFDLRFQDNTQDESIDPFDRKRVIMFYLRDRVDDVTLELVGATLSEASRQGLPVSGRREEWRTRSGIYHPMVLRVGVSAPPHG
jgi:hypothetical protein